MSSEQTVFNVRVNRDLKTRFEALAQDHRMSMSALMRMLMQLATSAYENQKLTTKQPGMTRIDIPLVLTRSDLSRYDLWDEPDAGDSVSGRSET